MYRYSYITFSLSWFLFYTDASTSNEVVHLQHRLKSLGTELVTLRNRLHVGEIGSTADLLGNGATMTANGTFTNASTLMTIGKSQKMKVSMIRLDQ